MCKCVGEWVGVRVVEIVRSSREGGTEQEMEMKERALNRYER